MRCSRAENSNTHRHLCEFTGLDFEMAIRRHYSEVMDVIEGIFFHMFEKLEKDYSMSLCPHLHLYISMSSKPLQWDAVSWTSFVYAKW